MVNLKKISINNTTSLQAFQIIRYIALIGISIFFTKFGLSREEIGIYETVLFISGLLTSFWVSGLIQAMLPIIKTKTDEKGSGLFNAFIVILILSFVTLFVGLAFEPVLRKLDSISLFQYYQLAILYTAISAPGNIIEYIYLLNNKFKSIINYGIVIFTIQIASICIALIFGFGIVGAIYALLGTAILKFLWAIYLIVKYSKICISIPFIKHFISLGFPLMGKFLLSGSATYIDGLIITSRFNLSAFAIFRFGARDLPLVTLMSNGLSNSMLPDFAIKEKIKKTMQLLKHRTQWHMHLLFPITMVTILLSKPLFPIVFNADFKDSAEIFMIYLLTISSRMVFPQTVAIGLGKTKALLGISIVELFINVSLSLLFVQWMGIVGVAWATVIAFWVEKVLISFYLYIRLGIKPSEYTPIKEYLLYTILMALVFVVTLLWM
jgi:O-antigen/teichoic acid export membrane protein